MVIMVIIVTMRSDDSDDVVDDDDDVALLAIWGEMMVGGWRVCKNKGGLLLQHSPINISLLHSLTLLFNLSSSSLLIIISLDWTFCLSIL